MAASNPGNASFAVGCRHRAGFGRGVERSARQDGGDSIGAVSVECPAAVVEGPRKSIDFDCCAMCGRWAECGNNQVVGPVPVRQRGVRIAGVTVLVDRQWDSRRRGRSPLRKLTDEQELELTRLYSDTQTAVPEIARRFEVGESSVYRIAQRHGASLRTRSSADGRATPQARHKQGSPAFASRGEHDSSSGSPTSSSSRKRAASGVPAAAPVWAQSSSAHFPELLMNREARRDPRVWRIGA